MKKIQVMCFALALALLMAIPVGVSAVDKAVFSVKTPEVLPKAGENFEVTVELANNPGFCAIQFTLGYDRELLECKYAELEEILGGTLSTSNPDADGGAIVAAASLKTLSGDGTVAAFGFTAKRDIVKFDFTLMDVTFADEDVRDILYEVAGADEETPPIEDAPEEVLPPPPSREEPDVNAGETGGQIDSGNEAEDYEVDVPKQPETGGKENEETADSPSFPDVVGHWSEPYIGKAVQQGLFIGDNEGNFRPDDSITRAQFVTVLWRMSGRPETDVTLPFTDVEDQIEEFKSAIAWAYANGYVSGTSETTFEPTATLTREAGMKILHAYSGGKIGMEFQFYAIYDGAFKDSAKISFWAKPAVYWGIYNTLISGVTTDTLVPQGTATRAQLAKILVTYLDII